MSDLSLGIHLNGGISGVEHAHDVRLHRAILYAVAYSDIFDCPLTAHEVHRFLAGLNVRPELVSEVLGNGALIPRCLSHADGYFALPGRESIIEIRRERERAAERVWPVAHFYGQVIARLPFVRMVAITGELAVNNIKDGSDIDYFIVTEPGRLWLSRALVILVVKLAALRGVTVCPNYLITEDVLSIDERNLYAAREMVQMVPISGLPIYQRLWETNAWVSEFLPNAVNPHTELNASQRISRVQRLSEALLRTRLGDRLERWEMNRKIRKFTSQNGANAEVAFSADWCKGHFDAHGQRTLELFAERIQRVEGLLQ